MRIKMEKTLAGPTVSYHAGREYDVENELGEALCADGRATPAEGDAPKAPKPKRQQGKRGGQQAENTSSAPAGAAETR